MEPIIQKFQSKPTVSFVHPIPARDILFVHAHKLDEVNEKFKNSCKIKAMRNSVKRNEDDHYGPECWYSGSCIKVVDDGRLRVAKLMDDERRVFNKVVGDVVGLGDKKLELSRILSLHVKSQRDLGGGALVEARHRWGVGVGQEMRRVQRIPCSEGMASTTFLPGNQIGCLVSDGDLGIWDISTGLRIFNSNLHSLVDVNYFRWNRGVLDNGFHPKSILMGDRKSLVGLDLRCGKQQEIKLGLEDFEHIRAMDSVGLMPYVYTVTDKNIILTDMRQTRSPIFKLGHGLGGESRVRDDGMDWVVVHNRWGDMVRTAMDWSHSQSDEWESQSDLVHMHCERPARVSGVLGGSRGVRGWGRTVARGGEWPGSCVEERCAPGFKGVDLARVEAGPVMIYAINTAGDSFAKTVVPKNEDEALCEQTLTSGGRTVGDRIENDVKTETTGDNVDVVTLETVNMEDHFTAESVTEVDLEQSESSGDKVCLLEFEMLFVVNQSKTLNIMKGFDGIDVYCNNNCELVFIFISKCCLEKFLFNNCEIPNIEVLRRKMISKVSQNGKLFKIKVKHAVPPNAKYASRSRQETGWCWDLLGKTCNFVLEIGGSKATKILRFKNKLDLFKFWCGITGRLMEEVSMEVN